jgi:hypothetical protein
VRARRSGELAAELETLERLALANEARNEHGELLAERGRRRGLPVRAGGERRLCPAIGVVDELRNQAAQLRELLPIAVPREESSVREVGHVLRRQSEVEEVRMGQSQLFAQEELTRLHVVLRRSLDRLDPQELLIGQSARRFLDAIALGLGEARENLRLVEGEEVGEFDIAARLHQGVLGEVPAEMADHFRVPPVERRDLAHSAS